MKQALYEQICPCCGARHITYSPDKGFKSCRRTVVSDLENDYIELCGTPLPPPTIPSKSKTPKRKKADAPKRKRRQYRCSICGELGHNARTCPHK